MINAVIEAISAALDGTFGDGCEIYRESIRQGLTEPCFFIQVLSPSVRQVRMNRYFRSYAFCIQYFPESEEKRKECGKAAEQMMDCLEYIRMDGEDHPLRGTEMHYEIVDDVLNFFVTYDCYVYRQTGQETVMGSMQSGIDPGR